MISLLSVARRDWVSCVLVLGPLHHHAAKTFQSDCFQVLKAMCGTNQSRNYRDHCETRHLW